MIARTVTQQALAAILAKPRDIERAVTFDPALFARIVTKLPTIGGTLYAPDGEPLISGGVTTLNYPHSFAWLVSSCDLKPHLRQIIPVIKECLTTAVQSGLTVRAHTSRDLVAAERFARKFGFTKVPAKDYYELRR